LAEVGKSTDGAVDIASSQHPLNSFAPDESVVIQGYVGARARPPNERAYPARANGGGSGLGELWVASAFDHRIGTASKLIAEQIGQLGRVFNRERIGPELCCQLEFAGLTVGGYHVRTGHFGGHDRGATNRTDTQNYDICSRLWLDHVVDRVECGRESASERRQFGQWESSVDWHQAARRDDGVARERGLAEKMAAEVLSVRETVGPVATQRTEDADARLSGPSSLLAV
jgi:hypothetical protein